MRPQTEKYRRKRVLAAICAVTVLLGGSAGIYAFSANAYSRSDKAESSDESPQSEKNTDDGIISASGTVTSPQLTDELGLKNTAVRLIVEKVLVKSADTVTSGTKLYRITSDSLSKAKQTLESELKIANSALLRQKTAYQSDKIKAYTLCQSELLLGKTAQQQYDNSLSELDSKLKSAYESYQQAQNTINSAPGEISKKKSELEAKQETASSLEKKSSTAQKQADNAEKEYTAAAEKYNTIAAKYNSSVSVVIYLGNALGKDTSGISPVQTVSVTTQGQKSSPSEKDEKGKTSSKQPQTTHDKTGDQSASQLSENTQTAKDKTASKPEPSESSSKKESTDLSSLYEKAYKEFTSQKQLLEQAKTSLKTAEDQYKTLSDSLSQINSELSQIQSSISEKSREISSLESSLSKAKSELTKLRSQYDSLSLSYETDKLELKNKLDTDTAACKNAQYNYQITCKTLEDELAKAQSAYDIAAQNLSIFEKSLADGYICANQDGLIDTLSCTEGKAVDISSPFVYYVDKSDHKTTVELDQNDITQINTGDTVMIYSPETGVSSGKITEISAGEAKSLADVRFNVTVTADENAKLSNGQSVTVYFNYKAEEGGLSARNGKKTDDQDPQQQTERSRSGGRKDD